jgi:FlaA1/EpsC-like NDP-sugar epimerase
MTERQALLLLLGISTMSGLLAVLSYGQGFRYSVILLALLVVGLVLFAVQLGRAPVVHPHAPRPDAPAIRLLANFPYKRHVATLAIDAVLVVVAYYAAYLLRFEGKFEAEQATFLRSIGPVVAIEVLALFACGTYRGLWRYTGVFDLLRLVRAVTLGVGATVVYFAFTTRFESLSRAVFVLDWSLLVLLLSGSRLAYRLLGEWLRPRPTACRRALIYGAGDGGALTLRELRNNARLGRQAVGFLDDDRDKRGTRIDGVPVLGGLDVAEELLATQNVEEVIVASTKIPALRVRELETLCAPRGVAVTRASLWIE